MKTRLIVIMVATFALLGLTGCKNYSSPKGVAQTAYKALMEDDVETFRSTLTQEMDAQYGNPTEMARLKEVLSPFQDFKFSKATILSSDQKDVRLCNPAGWHYVRSVDVRRTYETAISGKDSDGTLTPLFTIQANCKVEYNRVNQRGGPCYKSSGQFCQISQLK